MRITKKDIRDIIHEQMDTDMSRSLTFDERHLLSIKIINAVNKIVTAENGFYNRSQQAELGNLALQMIELASWG